VEIDTEDMLTLNAIPVQLVSAPGAGKYIEVRRVEFFLDYATTAYAVDTGEDLSIQYETTGEIFQVESTGFLDQASDQRLCSHTPALHKIGENEAVQLQILSGEILTGNSPLKVKVDYRVVEVLK